MTVNRAYIEIDLKKYSDNLKKYIDLVPAETIVMAVVKADAYGHGSVEIAKRAIDTGAGYLGVAWAREAIELRNAGISAPILILSEPTINIAPQIVELDIVQSLYTADFAKYLNQAAKEIRKIAKVHIKVDTGMSRVGVKHDEAIELIKLVSQYENIEIEGIFTHFACVDESQEYTLEQIKRFNNLISDLEQSEFKFKYVHCANTAATEQYKETHMNMVRIGIGSYKDIITFKSRIAFTKAVSKGTKVSYGAEWTADKNTNIATISAGYADGYVRALSNKGKVLIDNKFYPVIGRICMDMFMVDLGDDIYPIGEEVILIGKSKNNQITTDEIAEVANTIDYEILCGIGKRVDRVYKY